MDKDITTLLAAINDGNATAKDRLLDRIYGDLKKLASTRLAGEKPGHSLQPTALVHEAYLRLLGVTKDDKASQWDGRRHFFAAAAEAMRRILVESARRKSRQKHGAGFQRVPVDVDNVAAPEMAEELLRLNEALTRLAVIEPQMAELVSLRFFGGLTLKEAAEHLEIGQRTADTHWAYARAWLLAETCEE